MNGAREKSYKAFRNEHFDKSKYHDTRYRNRSKIFKPKTRSAVRKAQAAAAAALFSTSDPINIEAQDNSNQTQLASAALKKELLNYRLSRTNARDSIPWFLVAMGAHQDAYVGAVCVTKQYWKYQERPAKEGGENAQSRILFDRPDVLNIPQENTLIDPNCEWTRPAQTSNYLVVYYPMPISDVESMMKPSTVPGAPRWFEIPRAQIVAHAPDHTRGTRAARSGGSDSDQSMPTSGEFRIVWVQENFIRIDGEDYHFWSLGNERLLSAPMCTYEAYPHLFGERPYVFGFGAIETHQPIPMSPVDALQPLQQEANDLTNLRLDLRKQLASPITKVKRGRQIDLDAVSRKGQDTTIMVNDMEDIEFHLPPDTAGGAKDEQNILMNDFDELAGVFSQSSVQSNRSLNETVGGMKLLNSAAGSITEFDLRIWIETWVEPVLWQLIKLEEYYESDPKILALAGHKADLVQLYHLDEITDELLKADITISVQAGIGAADPMQQIEKFATAGKVVAEAFAPFLTAGVVPEVVPNFVEIANEVFGKAGYKNAGERFFKKAPPMQGEGAAPPDPAKLADIQAKKEMKAAELTNKTQIEAAKLQDKERERQTKVLITDKTISADLTKARMADMQKDRTLQHQSQEKGLDRQHQGMEGERGRQHQTAENHVQRVLDALVKRQEGERTERQAARDRMHQRSEGSASRRHEMAKGDAERGFKAQEGEAQRQHQSQESAAEREARLKEAAANRDAQAKEGQRDRSHQSVEAQRARGHEAREGRESRNHEARQKTEDRKVAVKTAAEKAKAQAAKPKPKK